MRTAEEIMKQWGLEMDIFISSSHYNAVISVINTARIEAIKESAERVKIIRYNPNPFVNYDEGLTATQRDQIDKQSILSLINEVK